MEKLRLQSKYLGTRKKSQKCLTDGQGILNEEQR